MRGGILIFVLDVDGGTKEGVVPRMRMGRRGKGWNYAILDGTGQRGISGDDMRDDELGSFWGTDSLTQDITL